MRAYAALIGLMLGLGCSGQTGSPACADVRTCVCDSVQRAVLVRATYVEGNAVVATAIVTEVLSTFENAPPIAVGDHLQGTPRLGVCSSDGPPSFAPGADVFVVFWPSYSSDASSEYSGSLSLLPWSTELTLSPGRSVKSAEIAALTDRATCLEHFPPVDSECDDTVDSCTAIRPHSTPRVGVIGLACTFALLAWVRRRR